tara:strand:- start:36 stop:194 length:159 start_codon:yes stop_codon:yes gene_type:complete
MDYKIPYSPINKKKEYQRVIHQEKKTKIKGYRKIKKQDNYKIDKKSFKKIKK